MTVRSATGNTRCDKRNERLSTPIAVTPESPQTCDADPGISYSQEFLKAQRRAKFAKEVARDAISRTHRASQALRKKAEALATAFDKAIQCAVGIISNSGKTVINENDAQASQESGQHRVSSYHGKPAGSGLVKKILNNKYSPFHGVSEVAKSLFGNKVIDPETREEFFNVVMRQSPQLRQLIEDLTEDRAQKKVETAIQAAKSDRIASKLAVRQVQEEIREAREELQKTREEAGAAIRQAEEEGSRARDEAMVAQQEAISRAQPEIQKTKKEAEEAIERAEETSTLAEQQALARAFEEINKAKEEVEAAKKMALEAIAKARGESQQAREEAEIVKKASEEAIRQAREESRKAREEAEITKQAAIEAVSKAQLESQKVKAEVEENAFMTSKAMRQATQDKIRHTQNEISQTRQEIAEASNNPASLFDESLKASIKANGSSCQFDKDNSYNIAAVLHEMRAPLHSISGFAKLMLEDNVSDGVTQKEFLSIMVQQSDNLSQLLENLSGNLSHNTETFSINKEPVSSHKLITEAVSSVQGMASQKKNLINCNISPLLPEIEADESLIKQVIINLLTHAIKFSHDNGTIEISAEARDNELLIQVKNQGEIPGQDPVLHICQQVIEAHSGRIRVESVEGEGSTFSITLPLAPVRSK